MHEYKQWVDHVTEYENRYTESKNADGTITHVPVEGEVIQEGTPQNAKNFNNMEDGIFNAQETAAVEMMRNKKQNESLENITNPNILINANFSNPVNQRGKSKYTGNQYTIDRWKMSTGAVDVNYVKVNEDCISLTAKKDTENIILFQYVEKPKMIKMKKFTVTAKYRATNGIKAFLYSSKDFENSYCDFGMVRLECDGEWHTIKKTFTLLEENITKFAPCCFLIGDYSLIDNHLILNKVMDKDGELYIEWAKVEYGDRATSFYPKNYLEELRDCQRYYIEIGDKSTDILDAICNSSVIDDTTSIGCISLPETLRKNPKVTINGSISAYNASVTGIKDVILSNPNNNILVVSFEIKEPTKDSILIYSQPKSCLVIDAEIE